VPALTRGPACRTGPWAVPKVRAVGRAGGPWAGWKSILDRGARVQLLTVSSAEVVGEKRRKRLERLARRCRAMTCSLVIGRKPGNIFAVF
jgi:hypothetical protein